MNAPRHDAEALKAALDAFAAAEAEDARLKRLRDETAAACLKHSNVVLKAREAAIALLRREEHGSVVHAGQFWKVDDGRLQHYAIGASLDQVDALRLTPPPSEKAA